VGIPETTPMAEIPGLHGHHTYLCGLVHGL